MALYLQALVKYAAVVDCRFEPALAITWGGFEMSL